MTPTWPIRFMEWANENAGLVTLLIAVVTAAYAVIQASRRRASFYVTLIEGPTFANTAETERKYRGQRTHRTAFAVYLQISNRGRAAASLAAVELGYHNFTLKYRFRWFWLQPTPVLTDFTRDLDGATQHFPFLMQRSVITGDHAETYLEPGKSTNGVVYFEQVESWGGFRPRRRRDGSISIRVKIRDGFGRLHMSRHNIRTVGLELARSYYPEFGKTHALGEITDESEP